MAKINRKNLIAFLYNLVALTMGSIIFAVGVSCFFDPNSIAPGGISGVAIIITKFVDFLPTGTWIALINVPIMIVGTYKFGFKFLASTMYAVGVSSLAVNIAGKYIGPLTDNLFLAAVGGAVLVGTGVGIVFRTGATTGGTDVIVKLLRLKFRHMKTGIVFSAVDGTICLVSGIVFKNLEVMMYAVIAMMLQGMIVNKVLYGGDGARMIYVISEKSDEIAVKLMQDVDVGATYFHGNGAYTGRSFDVLMVVMRAKQLPAARDIVRKVDDNAFMIVTNATSVFGQGFKRYDTEDI